MLNKCANLTDCVDLRAQANYISYPYQISAAES